MDAIKELLNRIFENPGEKIKKFSKIYFCLIVVGSVLSGLGYMIAEEFWDESILIGLGIILGGSISSVFLAFPVYAFGEIVDKTTKIEEHLSNTQTNAIKPESTKDSGRAPSSDTSSSNASQLRKYKQLLDNGVISVEAYESIKNNILKDILIKGE